MFKQRIVAASLVATTLISAGTLVLWSPWEASGAPEKWQCATLSEAVVQIRQDAANARPEAAENAARFEARKLATLRDLDAGMAWAERGCTGEDGGSIVPGLYRSVSESGTSTFVPK